jgi:hypothetical protein
MRRIQQAGATTGTLPAIVAGQPPPWTGMAVSRATQARRQADATEAQPLPPP